MLLHLFGSLLLAMHVPVRQIFFFCAILAVIAALLIIQLGRRTACDSTLIQASQVSGERSAGGI